MKRYFFLGLQELRRSRLDLKHSQRSAYSSDTFSNLRTQFKAFFLVLFLFSIYFRSGSVGYLVSLYAVFKPYLNSSFHLKIFKWRWIVTFIFGRGFPIHKRFHSRSHFAWGCTSRFLLGQIFSFCFRFLTLTCYRVFFFFSLSGILLITLLCYMLYVNSVIVCYLAQFLPEFLRVHKCNSVRGGEFFFSVSLTTNPCYPQHLVSGFVFVVFFNFILHAFR